MKIWIGKVIKKCEEKNEEEQTQNNNKQERKHTKIQRHLTDALVWQLPKHVTFRTKVFVYTSTASIQERHSQVFRVQTGPKHKQHNTTSVMKSG